MSTTPDTNATQSAKQSEVKKRLNTLLKGQTIQEVAILDRRELVIVLESGDRLFVDASSNLDVSVT